MKTKPASWNTHALDRPTTLHSRSALRHEAAQAESRARIATSRPARPGRAPRCDGPEEVVNDVLLDMATLLSGFHQAQH